jgi:serine/arginine repetitive matrix protein 2
VDLCVLSLIDSDLFAAQSEPSPVEAGTAISSDKQVIPEVENLRSSPVPQGRPGTTSPTPRLPGYIPGMPRPMTPRDLASDSDDQSRPHSTTPRATSPLSPNFTDHPSTTMTGLASGLRRDSNASNSRYSPRPTSPSSPSHFYLPKIPDGGLLPDDHLRSGESFSSEFDSALNSSILGRRRPASPLSTAAFQPMAVSSRPGTPSNVTWNPPVSPQKSQRGSDSALGHSRDGSWVSEVSDIHGSLNRSKSTTRSLRSPAFPDSPLIDRPHGSISPPGWNHTSDSGGDDNRPPSVASGADVGSPISTTNRALRSPTPTSNAPRSPTFANYDSSNGSPRISRQTAPSPPFSIASYHPLVFSPLANSSRSSLESAGSSYHSWDGRKETALGLFNDSDTPQSLWHDIGTGDNSSSATPGDSQDESWNAEAVIARYAGLTKADFVAIQDKLVGASLAKGVIPDNRDRVPSLRRRRPSTSQSNYSLNGRETKVCITPLLVLSPLPLNPTG